MNSAWPKCSRHWATRCAFTFVQVLAERKMCITGELVEFTTLAQSTVSQHLKVLREAGLVEGEVEGPATCYCLNQAGIRWLKERIGGWLAGCCDDVSVVSPAGSDPACCG